MDEFEFLLQQNRDSLERFVKYKIPNRCDAEDILQETYLAAYKNYKSLQSNDTFKAWLIGIAHHKCNDYFRKKAKCLQIPLDELPESALRCGGHGLTEISLVRDTLSSLSNKDKQIIYLYFFEDLPQEDIARQLNIPIGTVKSRLYYAKKNFKEKYPRKQKGELIMKKFPEYIPSYTITKSKLEPFSVKHEELAGMFIIPRLGEKCSFAMYDRPDGKQNGIYHLSVTGTVSIHGIVGVEIESKYKDKKATEFSTIFAQLTDTYCRYLGGIHTDSNGIRHMTTFLDDNFADSYQIGKDNYGFTVNRISSHLITESENELLVKPALTLNESSSEPSVFNEFVSDTSDICGRFDIQINGKTYDTVRIVDIQNSSLGIMLCEYYVDVHGHTVLWRRFNMDNWALKRYGKPWTYILPDSDRLTVNGQTFVHWYDCITDYVL